MVFDNFTTTKCYNQFDLAHILISCITYLRILLTLGVWFRLRRKLIFFMHDKGCVSLERVSVKLIKVCMVWLLIDSFYSINECNVSLRVLLVVGNSGSFENSNMNELVVKVVHYFHFLN